MRSLVKEEKVKGYFIRSVDLNTERLSIDFILFKDLKIVEQRNITLIPEVVPTYYSRVGELSKILLTIWDDLILIKNNTIQPEIDYTSDRKLIFDCYPELTDLNLNDLTQLAVKYERPR